MIFGTSIPVLKQLAIKWLFNFPLTQHLLLHYLGKAEQTKYALK